MEPTTDTIARPIDARPTEVDEATDIAETLVEEELLVEEISIDGMCGVY